MPADTPPRFGLTPPDAEALHTLAHRQVGEAHLPPFVAHTARELLALLDRALQEASRDPAEPAAFWTTLDALLGDLDACLAFGEAVAREESDARARLDALEARVAGRAFAPLLRLPVADLLETLAALCHRLDVGLYPLVAFPRAFEEVAGRLETLLAWQTALDERPDAPAIVPAGP